VDRHELRKVWCTPQDLIAALTEDGHNVLAILPDPVTATPFDLEVHGAFNSPWEVLPYACLEAYRHALLLLAIGAKLRRVPSDRARFCPIVIITMHVMAEMRTSEMGNAGSYDEVREIRR
jgi:hypothetical protein